MKITVTVVYPVTFEMELDKNRAQDVLEIKDQIYDMADKYLETSNVDPIIQDCTLPELID